MKTDKLINDAVEREEYRAHLRQELAEWEDLISGDDLPSSRARTLINIDQKKGE